MILAAFVVHQKFYAAGKRLLGQKLCVIYKIPIYIKVKSSEVMIWVREIILQYIRQSLMQHLE